MDFLGFVDKSSYHFGQNNRGMVCIGQKQFLKALELLHNVVTAPMSSLNAIAIEVYKKYILVSLIHLGQFSTSFPKYTSSVAQRNLKNYCQPYLELSNSYGTGKISELETFVQTNKEKFETDNNLGLVMQVVSSVYKHNIQRLTQTYLTLSLQDITNTIQLRGPKEAEMHVLQMIEDGQIYATIDQKDGMVRFLEDPEQYKTCGMIEHIDSSIKRFRSNVTREVTDLGEVLRKKMGIEEMPVMAMMMPRMGFSAGGMKGKRGAAAGKTEEKSEKAVFDLNLEGGFDAGAKIKIINEVIFY
ncbi:COP9 signalosome complex subunit 3-like [Capsicum annuum]